MLEWEQGHYQLLMKYEQAYGFCCILLSILHIQYPELEDNNTIELGSIFIGHLGFFTAGFVVDSTKLPQSTAELKNSTTRCP